MSHQKDEIPDRSRQEMMLGAQSSQILNHSKVLIVGMNSLGSEIAKNLALSGVGQLNLWDGKKPSNFDLASHLFLKPEDPYLGEYENRAKASLAALKEQEPNCEILIVDKTNPEEIYLQGFDSVVCCDVDWQTMLQINANARKVGCKFVGIRLIGLVAYLMEDFGDRFHFKTTATKSLELRVANIEEIESKEPCIPEKKFKYRIEFGRDANQSFYFGTDNLVRFERSKAISEDLTDLPADSRIIQVDRAEKTFTLESNVRLSKYKSGATVRTLADETEMNFDPISKAIEEFDWRVSEWYHIFLVSEAIDQFSKRNNGKLPKPFDEKDAQEVIQISKQICENGDLKLPKMKIDEKFIRKISFTCMGNISPMTSLVGGIAAAEVMKSLLHTFSPITKGQFFALNCIPFLFFEQLTFSDIKLNNDRYDGMTCVFGNKIVDKIKNLKLFQIGCGATGSEFLKICALMGVGIEKEGLITLADSDTISPSNLCRQLLYRSEHKNKSKAEISAIQIKKLFNSNLNISAKSITVDSASCLRTVGDDFWEKFVDVIVATVDNAAARQFLDECAQYYEKPMLECGTSGSRGTSTVVVPCVSAPWRSLVVSAEAVTVCLGKVLLTQPNHTIIKALELFNSVFNGNSYAEFVSPPFDDLKRLEYLAIDLFNKLFFEEIVLIFSERPRDSDFWVSRNNIPDPLKFDKFNPLHQQFISNFINLLHSKNNGKVYQILSQRNSENSTPIDYDKDEKDQLNFIKSIADCLAVIYKIESIKDIQEVRRLSGGIIPSIVTTTAIASSFMAMNLIILCSEHRNNPKRLISGMVDISRQNHFGMGRVGEATGFDEYKPRIIDPKALPETITVGDAMKYISKQYFNGNSLTLTWKSTGILEFMWNKDETDEDLLKDMERNFWQYFQLDRIPNLTRENAKFLRVHITDEPEQLPDQPPQLSKTLMFKIAIPTSLNLF